MKKSILFITLSNIGDAIMTTPVMQWIIEQYPECLVDIVCDKKSYEIFINCPNRNNIFLKNKEEGFFGVVNLLHQLRKKNYDVAIDLRTDFLLYFIHARKKIFKIKDNKIHSVEKHFQCLNINQKPFDTHIWISNENNKKLTKIIKNKKLRILSLGLGANSVHKIWPIQNYLHLTEKLSNKFDLILLLGDQRDKEIANHFEKETQYDVINLCGSLTLMETAAAIKLSTFFIGNDSGLGHIASAVKVKSFTIFAKEDPKRYHPWGEKAFWYQDRSKDISKIEPDLIFSKILEII